MYDHSLSFLGSGSDEMILDLRLLLLIRDTFLSMYSFTLSNHFLYKSSIFGLGEVLAAEIRKQNDPLLKLIWIGEQQGQMYSIIEHLSY